MMGSRTWLAAICLGLAMLLLGCGATPPAATELPVATEPPVADTPVPGTESPEPATADPAGSPLPTPGADAGPTPRPPVGEVPTGLLDAILADLAGRLGVPAGKIEVVRGEPVVWRDGSLGCPQPGMMYTQALVPGYQVLLRAGGQTYDYRAGESGFFALCEKGLAPVASSSAQVVKEVTVPAIPTIPTPMNPGLQGLVDQARKDLASRLSISAADIDLVELRPVVWSDGALGCPQPGKAYTQVQQEGLLIRLRAGKQIYPYHSGGGTPPFLCQQAVESTQ